MVSRGNVASPPTAESTGDETRRITTDDSQTPDEGSVRYDDLVKSVKNVATEPSRQPRFLGQSSGLTLARLVMGAIRVEALPIRLVTDDHHLDGFAPPTSVQAPEASLPPRHVASHLIELYFQYRTPHLPIIGRSQVKQCLERAYESLNISEPLTQEAEKAMFTTYMILAIALCDLPNPSGARSAQSEGCFRSASSRLERINTQSETDIETLRTVLLLAQFVSLCPRCGSVWHLGGIALRLCIDTGLHWETEEQLLNMDPYELQDRRCMWHATYQLDRSLSITLGRPFGIIDESTRVQLPDPWALFDQSPVAESRATDIHHQLAHNHLFKITKLESEIRHVLHSKSWSETPAYPKPDYAAWIQDINPRLRQWYSSIPDLDKAHPSSIFACRAYWDSVYNNAMLLLYRPSPVPLHSSMEDLSVSFGCSVKLISSIKSLQREGKIDVPWKSVHHLFMAGLCIIYGLWQCKDIRNLYHASASISALQSCASTLSALSETFPGASGCRDVFEALSSATVDWLLNNDAEELSRDQQAFEGNIQGLLQQLQKSHDAVVINEGGFENLSNVLSADSLALGEMLSSAAQFPSLDYGGFGGFGGFGDFGDLGLDPASECGAHSGDYFWT